MFQPSAAGCSRLASGLSVRVAAACTPGSRHCASSFARAPRTCRDCGSKRPPVPVHPAAAQAAAAAPCATRMCACMRTGDGCWRRHGGAGRAAGGNAGVVEELWLVAYRKTGLVQCLRRPGAAGAAAARVSSAREVLLCADASLTWRLEGGAVRGARLELLSVALAQRPISDGCVWRAVQVLLLCTGNRSLHAARREAAAVRPSKPSAAT